MIKNAFCLAILACCTACVSPEYTRNTRNSLDQAISYTEIPKHELPRKLSGGTEQATAVPDGKEVDIDSNIHIHIDSDAVKLLGTPASTDYAKLYPSVRAQKLTDTLTTLNKIIEVRMKVLAAFEKIRLVPAEDRKNSTAFSEFAKAVSEFGQLRAAFNILPIWEDGTFTAEEAEAAFKDKTYTKVGALLQRELDLANTALQQTVDEANKHTASLKLAAFLQSSDGDISPIHLEGYDLFANKEVKLKSGFVMDADARKAFESQYSQTIELARQAEKIRTGESTFNDALLASGVASLKEIKERIDTFKPLLTTDWPATFSALQKDIADLNTDLGKTLQKYGKDEESLFKVNVSSLATALSNDLPLSDIKEIIDQASALSLEWKSVKPDTLVDVFNKTALLKARVSKLAAANKVIKLDETFKTLNNLRDTLEKQPLEISNETWKEYLPKIEQTQSFQNIRQLAQQFQSLRQFVIDAPNLLGFVDSGSPIKINLEAPEIQAVPLANAPDTKIDLPRTARMPGDSVFVSAVLNVGDSEVMRSDASFAVKYFNWHPLLSPNVILTKATNPHSSYDGDFKFEPSVSWLYRYYPRDTSTTLKALAKFFQPGFGLHAAFLDQNAQKETEIGIGGTISLWDDRIVTGLGINLMNNSKGYFYIGSNLISLLQGGGSAKGTTKGN